MKKLIVGIDLAKEGGDITIMTHVSRDVDGVMRINQMDVLNPKILPFWICGTPMEYSLGIESVQDIDCQVVDSILKK